MKIDAHQHFWRLERGDYGWLTPDLALLWRDFLPVDLAPHLAAAGIGGTILVQAAPTVAETEFLLSLAGEHAFIKGVVGWGDFEAKDAADQIARLARHTALVGLRPMIQDIPDPDWMLSDRVAPAFAALIDQDLAFDALVKPQHLGALHRLLDRHPGLRCVIDHGAKPDIAGGQFTGWAAGMAALARDTGAFCKLSGLVTEAGPGWTAERLKPYAGHILATFGAERVIWGSDWPVCTLAASYAEWDRVSETLLAGLSPHDREAVLGGNALSFYRRA